MALGDPLEFDQWAADYDAAVQRSDAFPFDRYDVALDRAVEMAGVLVVS